MRGRKAGLRADRLTIRRQRLGNSALALQGVAEIVLRGRVGRLEAESFAVSGDCLLEFSCGVQRGA